MLLKCVEIDCTAEIVQDDVKFSKNAPQRFAEQICLWYPELSNIVIALLYYKMCRFATYQNENRIKVRMDRFAEKVASRGIADDALPPALRRSSRAGNRSSDEAWEYITSHRNLCMENTRLICETVDNAVEVLEGILAAGGKGKARARSSLRVMRLYGVPTSQDPLERNELKYVVRCVQYIKQLVGEKFDAVFARVIGMEHGQQTIAEHMYFHHTEFLLEYYKCIVTRRYGTAHPGVRLRGGAGVPADAEPYDKVNVTAFTVGIAEESPVQTAQDLTDDIYLLTALYDEHERNGAGFDNDAFIREKEAAHAGSPITTEDRLQWAGEAIDAQLKDVSVDGLKRFFGEEAGDMLKFIFPTPYTKGGSVIYPAAAQGTRASGPYKDYSVRPYTYTVSVAALDENNRPILDKDGNPTYVEETRTGCDVECEYLWRIEFDGVNHLLQEYGWATIGSDGNPVFTEEGEAHYKRAVELAGNYKSFLESGGLDFTPGIGYGSSYKGSYQQLIINEYEERQASAMPLDRNMEEPLKGTYVVTSDYGIVRTITSVGIQNKVHHGIDMAQGMGSPIYSTADGIVVATGSNNTNGIHMLIYVGSSGNKNYYTLFNHCSGLYAKVGDRVSKGQQVAAVGSTGASTGAHLDFGVLVCDGSNGAWYADPRTLVPSIPKP